MSVAHPVSVRQRGKHGRHELRLVGVGVIVHAAHGGIAVIALCPRRTGVAFVPLVALFAGRALLSGRARGSRVTLISFITFVAFFTFKLIMFIDYFLVNLGNSGLYFIFDRGSSIFDNSFCFVSFSLNCS